MPPSPVKRALFRDVLQAPKWRRRCCGAKLRIRVLGAGRWFCWWACWGPLLAAWGTGLRLRLHKLRCGGLLEGQLTGWWGSCMPPPKNLIWKCADMWKQPDDDCGNHQGEKVPVESFLDLAHELQRSWDTGAWYGTLTTVYWSHAKGSSNGRSAGRSCNNNSRALRP
jgi:hypothetical protein